MLQSLVCLDSDVHETHSHLAGYGFVGDVNGGPPHLSAGEKSMQGDPRLHEKSTLDVKILSWIEGTKMQPHCANLLPSIIWIWIHVPIRKSCGFDLVVCHGKHTQAPKLTAVKEFPFIWKEIPGNYRIHTRKSHSVSTNITKYLLKLNNRGRLMDTCNREKQLDCSKVVNQSSGNSVYTRF